MILYEYDSSMELDLNFVASPSFRLCRVQRRVQKGFEVLEYYANNQWDFDNANILHLRTLINSVEKERYPIQDDGMSISVLFAYNVEGKIL